MTDVAIRAQGLSKLYRIGERQRYKSLRESIMKALAAPFRTRGRRAAETIWALDDVSFEVMRGEVVGVIGRNGAGKTTLLKILSRITEPTRGRVEVYGRVGSLLEVGTGFHPELTGRENIYLNGAILGMKRAEIERKFDEIVAFAEVERFLDTPVKHFSTGMYLRLAFAVAAHLEPEILLVDEVLAVGDASFQKKCLGKMGDVAKGGRTVLFVSHNMTAITSLCTRALWLGQGRLLLDDDARKTTEAYLLSGSSAALTRAWDEATAPGTDKVRLRGVRLVLADTRATLIKVSTPFTIEVDFWNHSEPRLLNLSLVIYSGEGVCVFNTASQPALTPPGLVRGTVDVPGDLLNEGWYLVRVLVVQDAGVRLIDLEQVIRFEVHDTERIGGWHGRWVGVVRPRLEWRWDVLDRQPPPG